MLRPDSSGSGTDSPFGSSSRGTGSNSPTVSDTATTTKRRRQGRRPTTTAAGLALRQTDSAHQLTDSPADGLSSPAGRLTSKSSSSTGQFDVWPRRQSAARQIHSVSTIIIKRQLWWHVSQETPASPPLLLNLWAYFTRLQYHRRLQLPNTIKLLTQISIIRAFSYAVTTHSEIFLRNTRHVSDMFLTPHLPVRSCVIRRSKFTYMVCRKIQPVLYMLHEDSKK